MRITQILPIRVFRYLFLSDELVSEFAYCIFKLRLKNGKWYHVLFFITMIILHFMGIELNSMGSVKSKETMPPFSLFRQKFEQ